MALDYGKTKDAVRKPRRTAKDGTMTANGVLYKLTFNTYAGCYDVSGPTGETVVSFSCQKLALARACLSQYLGE